MTKTKVAHEKRLERAFQAPSLSFQEPVAVESFLTAHTLLIIDTSAQERIGVSSCELLVTLA